jgi:hypothetical protein
MDQSNPEIEPQSQTESRPETVEARPEVKAEASAEQYTQGAEMLEEPANGSFISTLQLFVAWVKSLTKP